MTDLVSRDEVRKILADMIGLCRSDVLHDAAKKVDDMPAIDAIPVEWLVQIREKEFANWKKSGNGYMDVELVRVIDNIIIHWRKGVHNNRLG